MKKTTAGSHLTGPLFNLILCLLPLPFLCGLHPVVDFTEERIDIHVYRNEIVVDGFYLYRNRLPFPVHQGLSIPFPVDERHPLPQQLRVRLLDAGQTDIGPLTLWGEQRITLRLDANGSSVVHVQYRQQAPDGDARYILLTTSKWRKPLEKADYRMYAHGVEIVSSNYEMTMDGQGFLGFKRENFLPAEDWIFSWKEKKA